MNTNNNLILAFDTKDTHKIINLIKDKNRKN